MNNENLAALHNVNLLKFVKGNAITIFISLFFVKSLMKSIDPTDRIEKYLLRKDLVA